MTGLVVRLPDSRVLRLGNPITSPVAADVSEERWLLRGRSARWLVEVEGTAPRGASHVLPVPLPRERRNVAGALEHLGGSLRVSVRSRRGALVWKGEAEPAALEHGGLERAAAEAARRGSPGSAAVPPEGV